MLGQLVRLFAQQVEVLVHIVDNVTPEGHIEVAWIESGHFTGEFSSDHVKEGHVDGGTVFEGKGRPGLCFQGGF